MKITPVLYVDKIEDSLPFWMERLGFQKTVEVPEGEALGFVILVKENEEVMLQSWASLRKDAPRLMPASKGMNVAFFMEVDNFEDTVKRIQGCNIVLPERTTFYGMREIGVREPCGHIVVFAAKS
ncbi:MAG: hypothetical protein C5B54_08175 [Acidobacteria bacterium]|nr:MAG: hypothetical protein C5B54_08175 [Acidobacteriota bacterium]